MGKRLMSQNRGKGTPTYRATSSRFKANLEHIKTFGDETIEGVITEVVHDTARNTPIVRVKFGNGEEKLILAPEGIGVGDKIAYGVAIEIKPGNTLPLKLYPGRLPDLQHRVAARRRRRVRALIRRLRDSRGPRAEESSSTDAIRRYEVAEPQVQGHHRRRCGRRQDREAVPAGRHQVVQDGQQGHQVARCPWCRHERSRPPVRWRRQAAPWQAQDSRQTHVARP